jgi:Gas vesicle protein K
MTDQAADKLLTTPPDLDPFACDVRRADRATCRRVHDDPDNVARGLAQLVLTVIELLRQLMERQALRRVEAGGLDDETVERLGSTLMALADRMEELKQTFGLRDEDLNLNLGPLGRLL